MAIKRYVGLGKESVYGIAVSATRYAEAVGSLKPDQNWIIPPPVASRNFRKKNLGPYRTRGTIGDFDAEPENILGELLYGVFGYINTTNMGSGVYSHEFKPADSLPSYTVRLGVEQTERVLPGCLVNSLTLRFPHNDNVKVRAEIFSGFPETKASLATPALSNLQAFVFNADASSNVAIESVNRKAYIYDLEVTFKNNIPFDRGALDGRTFSKKRYGQFEATGKLSAYFDDTTDYDRFIAGTEFDIQGIHCYGPIAGGTEKYYIYLDLLNCVFLRDAAPDVTPQNEPLAIDAPFKAFYDSAFGFEARAILQNKVSSY